MQHQPCVLKPPLEHKRPCAPGLVSQTHAFGLGMHAVHNGPIGRRQQPQKRRVRLTQLDGHGAVVHRTDARGNHRIQNPAPRRHDRGVAQPLQGKDHVGCVDGTSVRESDPRPEMKRVGVGDGVNLPRFRHTRDNFEVRIQLHQAVVQLVHHPHVLQAAGGRRVQACDGRAFVVPKHVLVGTLHAVSGAQAATCTGCQKAQHRQGPNPVNKGGVFAFLRHKP